MQFKLGLAFMMRKLESARLCTETDKKIPEFLNLDFDQL